MNSRKSILNIGGDIRMINFYELYELSYEISKKIDELFNLTINGVINFISMEY